MSHWVEVSDQPGLENPHQQHWQELGFEGVQQSRVYYLEGPSVDSLLEQLSRDSRRLADPVSERLQVDGRLSHPHDWVVEVSYRAGVTDNEARVVEDVLGTPARSARRYYLLGGSADRAQIEALAARHWANLLIQRVEVVAAAQPLPVPPSLLLSPPPATAVVALPPSIAELEALSRQRLLALTGQEMHLIQRHFAEEQQRSQRLAAGLPADPTEVELEALAQTWSEHCKHKIFNDRIIYREDDREELIEGLFKTYIAGSTARCQRDWLVSIFTDNAGVIAWSERYHLVFKVETHNAPSALEPYGGALTGIVGVNRDPAGTGLGSELLFNTDVFCFGPLDWDQPLPPGLHHPRRLYQGVRQGVEDGGNQSGIPTVNGALFFDPRYLGRPLVFCGTGALMPVLTGGQPTHLKSIEPGDLIVMAGGRVGKDGIHGATFSSLAIGSEAPVGVVQIGDPITQKRLLEMLGEARQLGLYRAITDNGAGGLCSSVGEMAEMCQGAHLNLESVPLKYPGLAAWEILVSESQERMTLAVPPQHWEQLSELARRREVEVSAVGTFNSSGFFSCSFQGQPVMRLALKFLHGGWPRRTHPAHWPGRQTAADRPESMPDPEQSLLQLLNSANICSREALIRQYDHEVQGTAVVRPLVGIDRDGPSDAAVLRPDHESDQGVVISCAINPHYGDHDPEAMAELLVDEAIRNAVAVGADPDHVALLDNFCWPDPVGDPFKMAQLVRTCRGLARAVEEFQAPLISGKDSMKNDYHGPDGKLSIPPTLLVSAIANIPDVNLAVTMDLKQIGDRVYLLGPEQSALAGSQYARMLGFSGGQLGKIDYPLARKLYSTVYGLARDGLLGSCHDCSEGGLAVALAEKAIAGRLGMRLELPDSTLRLDEQLFGEGPCRLVVSIDATDQEAFEARLEGLPWAYLGWVTPGPSLMLGPVELDVRQLQQAWQGGIPL